MQYSTTQHAGVVLCLLNSYKTFARRFLTYKGGKGLNLVSWMDYTRSTTITEIWKPI